MSESSERRLPARQRCQGLCPGICFFILMFSVAVTFSVISPVGQAQAQDAALLKHEKSIPLPNVRGRIDHMAADVEGQRLFVAAPGNNSLEVINLRTGVHARSIRGLSEPQGVLYIPEFDKIFVTNGGDGTCKVFDGRSFKLIQKIRFSEDADNIRYDPLKKQVYIGYGKGAIGIVDAKTGKRVGDVPLNAHPEAFELEKAGSRVFANLPIVISVVIIDRQKREVFERWPLGNEKGNYPMALDEAGKRLFIGCHNPAKVLIYSTESGKPVGSLDIAGDADDLFYDSRNKRLYVSCGEGFLYVFRETGNNSYEPAAKLATAKGARTSLLVPENDRFYVAIPGRSGQRAGVRIYTIL